MAVAAVASLTCVTAGGKNVAVNEHLVALFDAIARQDEHSHVAPATRRKIAEVIQATDNLDVLDTARLAVGRLDDEELARVLADWIDSRVSI